MVRYFYAWTPGVVLVGTVVVLSSPYLAVIVLMGVLAAAAAGAGALALAILAALYALCRSATGRALRFRRRKRNGGRRPIALHDRAGNTMSPRGA